jgi:hypothetical protein
MEGLNAFRWKAVETYVAHGVRFAVRVEKDALAALALRLPPGSEVRHLRVIDRVYSIFGAGEASRRGVRRFNLLYGDSDLLARSTDPAVIMTVLADDLQLRVAELAPKRIFVHAGVVGWRGRAIVLPGQSLAGKSTLVAELVRAGATYYSDEYAVLDGRGRVWPFARPLSLRARDGAAAEELVPERLGAVGDAPLAVGTVWLTKYETGVSPVVDRLSPGRGALAMLEHTVPAQRRPKAALAALGVVARRATFFTGPRGEAAEAARWLLSGASA